MLSCETPSSLCELLGPKRRTPPAFTLRFISHADVGRARADRRRPLPFPVPRAQRRLPKSCDRRLNRPRWRGCHVCVVRQRHGVLRRRLTLGPREHTYARPPWLCRLLRRGTRLFQSGPSPRRSGHRTVLSLVCGLCFLQLGQAQYASRRRCFRQRCQSVRSATAPARRSSPTAIMSICTSKCSFDNGTPIVVRTGSSSVARSAK